MILIWLAHIFQKLWLNHQLEWVVNRSRSFQICHRFGENRFAPTRQGGAKVFSEAVVAGPSFGTLQVGNFRGERSTERWGEWFHLAGWHDINDMTCRWNLSHQNCNGHSLLQMNFLVEFGFCNLIFLGIPWVLLTSFLKFHSCCQPG